MICSNILVVPTCVSFVISTELRILQKSKIYKFGSYVKSYRKVMRKVAMHADERYIHYLTL